MLKKFICFFFPFANESSNPLTLPKGPFRLRLGKLHKITLNYANFLAKTLPRQSFTNILKDSPVLRGEVCFSQQFKK